MKCYPDELPYPIPGVEIIRAIPGRSCNVFVLLAGLAIFALSFIFLGIGSKVMFCVAFLASIAVFFLSFSVFGELTYTYEVHIDPSVSFTEVMSHYFVSDRRGNVYYITQ